MKKGTICLILLLPLVGFMGGCAVTDYTGSVASSQRFGEIGVDNQALGCASASVSAQGFPQRPVNDPNTGLPATSDSLWQPWVQSTSFVRCPNLASNLCWTNASWGPPGGFPVVCLGGVAGGVSLTEASDWEGTLGSQIFLGEAQVFSPTSLSGTYVLAGGKSLGSECDTATGLQKTGAAVSTADCDLGHKALICHRPPGNPANAHTLCVGRAAVCAHLFNHPQDTEGECGAISTPPSGFLTARLNNFYRPQTTAFSCVGSAIDGLYGGVEGQLLGDSLANGRLPGLQIDSVATDNGPGFQWAYNIRAVSAFRQAKGFCTLWGFFDRAYEGRHEFVMPSAGLAEFLNGEPLTIHAPNSPASVMVQGTMRDDGMLELGIQSLTYGDATFTPSTPILVSVDRNLKLWQIGKPGVNQEQVLRDLARFAIAKVPMDDAFRLGGIVKELGIKLPDIRMRLNPATIARFAGVRDDQLGSPERTDGRLPLR